MQADIVVSGEFDTDWRLVVEVKRAPSSIATAEEQIGRYMDGYNCSLGLLVTADDIRVYKETYATPGSASIERVAIHPLPADLRQDSDDPSGFERAVQHWLERLAVSGTAIVDDPRLAATLDEHIVPILGSGKIRAGKARRAREQRQK